MSTAPASARGPVRAFLADAAAAARAPLDHRHVTPFVYLLGVFADSATTCFVEAVPGVYEANPFARAGMALLGGPQVFMLLVLLLLAPLAVLLAGRPSGLLASGVWVGVLALGILKLGVGVSNVLLLLRVTG